MLITEPFQGIVASQAAKLGAAGYHTLVFPHPVWGKSDEELQALVEQAAAPALAQLTRSSPRL